MKKIEEKIMKNIASIALRTAKKQINSACMLFGYEPKKPDSLKKKK